MYIHTYTYATSQTFYLLKGELSWWCEENLLIRTSSADVGELLGLNWVHLCMHVYMYLCVYNIERAILRALEDSIKEGRTAHGKLAKDKNFTRRHYQKCTKTQVTRGVSMVFLHIFWTCRDSLLTSRSFSLECSPMIMPGYTSMPGGTNKVPL